MRAILIVFVLLVFWTEVFAQNTPVDMFPQVAPKAEKIDEFGRTQCGEFISHVANMREGQKRKPNSKIYVIYYAGKNNYFLVWDKKLKKHEQRSLGPVRGQARNYAESVGVYMKNGIKDGVSFDPNSIVLVDGGFREKLTLEVWIVPQGVPAPKPSPTVEKKDVVFSKGRTGKPRDCSLPYDGY